MASRILITGSLGLVGSAVRIALESSGISVTGFDLHGVDAEYGDVRNPASIAHALGGCTGIVHLAAVSRVIWGERDPENCWATNVDGLQNVINLAQAQTKKPWMIFASSREVYGQPEHLPASEDTPLSPVNIYGRSKVEGERLIMEARTSGMRTAIIRLSNVYGRVSDHHDRVVPAFARGAVQGQTLRIDGADHTFDFTHIDDTVRGIVGLVQRMETSGENCPPIHFLTGQATSLGQLASLAQELGHSDCNVVQAPPRNFDVSQFFGNPQRAFDLLGWEPRISIKEGLGQLISDFRTELKLPLITEPSQHES